MPYKNQCPPVDGLCYAIRNILHPEVSLCQIPDLLDLLSIVELYRQQAFAKARAALVFNEFYRNQKTGPTLTPEEEKRIQRAFRDKNDKNQRSMYVLLILQFCYFVSILPFEIFHLRYYLTGRIRRMCTSCGPAIRVVCHCASKHIFQIWLHSVAPLLGYSTFVYRRARRTNYTIPR